MGFQLRDGGFGCFLLGGTVEVDAGKSSCVNIKPPNGMMVFSRCVENRCGDEIY